MLKFNALHNRRGAGMIIGFFAIMIVFALGVSFLSVASSSILTSKRETLRVRALSCAESGLDQAISYLMSGGPNGETNGEWRTSHPSADPDDHSGDTWQTGTLGTGETYTICARSGSGITSGKIVVTCFGTVSEGGVTMSRAIKAVLNVRKENVNVWSNAIFGGVGQAGKSINGNVKIRGSVHLLGDGESYTDLDSDGHWDAREPLIDTNGNGKWDLGESYADTDGDGHWDDVEPFQDVNGNGTRDPALTVTDLAEEISGNANMGNNYGDMAADLRSRVPDPPTTTFGGETVESLSAKLRVKHGKVNISGSATVGNPNQPGDGLSIKETMDGAYVSDGFGGTAGSGSVYADNGYSNGYDLGDGVVTMPLLTYGEYKSYDNYLDYLKASATVYSGNLTVRKGTAFSISGPNGTLAIDVAGNMTVSGIVYVTGSVTFGDAKTRLIYSGSGTVVTPQTAYVHCDLLPNTKFATGDTLGLIAGDKIELATGGGDAQLTMAIAMYAQHKIISNKQSQIAGTMVTSYFSMANVPSLYQVPELANHLPPGMPGADPIYIATISTESWEEIRVP
ncbi:MAG: hypothetical protein M1133_08010 [Armatimonadetes bacterium]|nr:hypothetical protein [Armatimonadota bacterium]